MFTFKKGGRGEMVLKLTMHYICCECVYGKDKIAAGTLGILHASIGMEQILNKLSLSSCLLKRHYV